jgi:outer membrane receptor protein involved in Fe transport
MTSVRFIRPVVVVIALVVSVTTADAERLIGRVTDRRGAPIAGATVAVKGGTGGPVRTDSRGGFALVIADLPATLVVSGSGFSDRVVAANDESELLVVLEPQTVSEAITVTATRTPTRLSDAPSSVVVVSAAELASAPQATIDDTLRQVPGFTLFRRSGSRTANPTSQGVTLRGVGASGASRAVVIDDGVPLNDPFGGWVYWGRVAGAALSQVEVLRGGGADLYGSAAIGGVINLVRRPAAGSPSLLVEGSTAGEETSILTLFSSMSRGAWSAVFSGELFDTAGYILVPSDERGAVDRAADAGHHSGDLTLSHGSGDGVRAFLRGSYFDEARNNGSPAQTNDTVIRQLVGGIDSPLLGGFTILRAYGSRQLYDQTFSAIAADRQSERLTILQRVPVTSAGTNGQWSRSLGDRDSVIGGVELHEVSGSSDEQQLGAKGTTFVSSRGRQRSESAWLEDLYVVSTRLNITAVVRGDRWQNFDASRLTAPPSPAAAVVDDLASRSATAVTPRLSVVYTPWERVVTTASFYRGFRAPTLNELYRSFRVGNVVTESNESLGPENLQGIEAGVRLASADGRYAVRSTLFSMTTDSTIANVTLSSTPALITRQRQNIGSSRSRGVELDADLRLAPQWVASAGYLLSDARITSSPESPQLEGLRIPQVARNQVSVQLRRLASDDASLPSILRGLTVAVDGRWSSSQFDDDLNQLPLGSFFVADAFLARQIAPTVDLTLAGENLFGRHYAVGRTPVTTLGAPREVRLGVRMTLGK